MRIGYRLETVMLLNLVFAQPRVLSLFVQLNKPNHRRGGSLPPLLGFHLELERVQPHPPRTPRNHPRNGLYARRTILTRST